MFLAAMLVLTGSINVLKIESAEETNDNDDRDLKDRKPLLLSIPDDQRVCIQTWNGSSPHFTNCSQYYRCENGIATLLHCQAGYLFNKDTKECVPRENAKCSDGLTTMPDTSYLDDYCHKQVDGLYSNYTSKCKEYIRCQSGKTVSRSTCPEGQSFSFLEQSCVSSQEATCVEPVCHPEENGFFWLPGSLCRSYYYCQNGSVLAFNCPKGKEFSKDSKDCVTNGQCYEPICIGKPDGNHTDTTHDCKRSLQCKGGVLESVASCPPRMLHDGRSCLPAAFVRCERPEVTAVSVETIHDDCLGYSDGAHVLPATNCRRYQICQDGKAIARFSCPAGRRFNGQNCVPQNTVPCEDLCTGKADGYQPDETEGCRKYHYCQKGRTTERRSCPEGSLFSGRMCLPTPFVTCKESLFPNSNPCLGLPDGFHADYLHGCSQYFYCSGYSAVLRTSCPKQMLWNGKQCVPPKDALCQGPEKSWDCHGLPTGLYQDKASGCEKYYFCYNGNRTLLSCPKGKLFDGEACVSEKDYVCPSQESKTCYNKTDGYRVDEESGCRAYYYCSNGHKTTYVCSTALLFNGSDCIPAENYTCPFSVNDCSQKPTGYHPDFKTRCRKYYYCQDGSKLNTISCGVRKAFDGIRCVSTTSPDTVCRAAALKEIIASPEYY